MYLSDSKCKQAEFKERPYKLTDGDGMYLFVTHRRSKLWRMDYRVGDKRKTLSLGPYPEVSLKEAREKRLEFRKQLRDGIDPGAARQEAKAQLIFDATCRFETVALEWHHKKAVHWTPAYTRQVLSVLRRDFFPFIGDLDIRDVTALQLLDVLRKIEARGALDALSDARTYSGQIFRYGIATGRGTRDVAADIRDAFTRHIPQNHAALPEDDLPAFLQALDAHKKGWCGRLGLKLLLLTLLRTTEVRGARWSEINLDEALWVIPAERMKKRREHVVPLSRQAVALIGEIRAKSDNPTYLFPNQQRRKHPIMSENTMLNLVDELGFGDKTTVHGLRSTGSTILHESRKFDSLAIERQLAHVDGNTVRGTYNKAQYLPERREMLQWWADLLEEKAAKKA